jgi:rubredoxin
VHVSAYQQKGGGIVCARFETDGIDDFISELDNIESIPLMCDCPECEKPFEIKQSDAFTDTVICPHCGAELEDF